MRVAFELQVQPVKLPRLSLVTQCTVLSTHRYRAPDGFQRNLTHEATASSPASLPVRTLQAHHHRDARYLEEASFRVRAQIHGLSAAVV
jgi:hypothetical protein